MTARMITLVALAALCAAAAGRPAASGGTEGIPPASTFTAHVTNRWFPLVPGTRYAYTGIKDGIRSREVLTVTRRTATIAGIPCVVVHDRLYVRGHLEERTTDWYSQDAHGNVWYLGEDTAELDAHGNVTTTEGTWRAGVAGAVPGIYMPADPSVGASGRQEYYKGHAEDHFRVVGRFSTVIGNRTTSALLTEEWSPLEPGVLDHKLYARGIGTILEQTERGGNERNELVGLTHG